MIKPHATLHILEKKLRMHAEWKVPMTYRHEHGQHTHTNASGNEATKHRKILYMI